MAVVRSTDGGASFSSPAADRVLHAVLPEPGGARDCGDGPFFCGAPGFVFHRVPLEPRLTADQTGALTGVFATWNAVDPASVVPSTSPYSSAGPRPGRAGRWCTSPRSTDNGAHVVGAATPVETLAGRPRAPVLLRRRRPTTACCVAVWQDNRTDDAYSVQLPIGNRVGADGRARQQSGDDVVAHVRRRVDRRR